MNLPRNLHTLPIPSRPPARLRPRVLGLVFFVVFNTGCLMIHGCQLLFLLPLKLLTLIFPLPGLQLLYEAGVRWTKGSFGKLAVLMCQWFAPTRIVMTFEGNSLKEDDVIVRDRHGRVVKLKLPERLVLVANHQIYADWWYLWCLTYYMGGHKDVLIILKDSLKWIPIVGWGMQIYHFIFLARSWASDRQLLSRTLSKLAARIQLRATPLSFMIFPEGTLVSKNTRPLSKKFADKIGVEDLRNTLLPRSTGLFYCLHSLRPQIPDLHLLDITIAYEGIPPQGYGQSYYTLRSIFLDGIPPPKIHMHLRLFDVRKEVPLGYMATGIIEGSSSDRAANLVSDSPESTSRRMTPDSHVDSGKEGDLNAQEAAQFEGWLWKLWREKDALIDRYLASGSFVKSSGTITQDSGVSVDQLAYPGRVCDSQEIEIPMELRSRWEIFDAFAFFAPGLFWTFLRKAFG